MAQLSKKEKDALRSMLTKMAFGIVGSKLNVKDTTNGELGYTQPRENAVYVALAHPYYEDLRKYAVIMFIEGVFAHEVMHRCYTNFTIYMNTIHSKPLCEQEVMSNIINVMEDSAIEFRASEFMGNDLVRSIDFMRSEVFKKSSNIETFPTPFGQFFSACIQYGDSGKIKGEFTVSDAERIFNESVPLMDACTVETDPKKRAELSEQVFELSRPLWEKEAKEKEAFENLLKELGKMHSTKPEVDGVGFPGEPDSMGSSLGDYSDDDDDDKVKRPRFIRRGLLPGEPDEAEEDVFQDYEPTKEDINRVLESLKEAEKDLNKGEEESGEEDLTDLDLSVSDGYNGVCKNARCANLFVKLPDDEMETAYNSLVKEMSGDITLLTNQLERIFRQKVAEKVYRSSGQLNIKRLSSSRLTPYIFSRRKEPTKSDLAVAIAVDNSGSMGKHKMDSARRCVVGLAEVFANLKIPIYVFGFSADESVDVDGKGKMTYPAVHYHFINWSNRKSERVRLLSMKARCNNFDGYSIRYGGELLRKVSAENKLLIVISDGIPLCNAYDRINGIIDTKLAVKEASKYATVVGVLLESTRVNVHREMYGYNFIDCQNSRDLFHKLGKMVARLMTD